LAAAAGCVVAKYGTSEAPHCCEANYYHDMMLASFPAYTRARIMRTALCLSHGADAGVRPAAHVAGDHPGFFFSTLGSLATGKFFQVFCRKFRNSLLLPKQSNALPPQPPSFV
jgi:hypothetical protein